MKRIQLKPHVFKVEGAVNFAFYNMLNGSLCQYSSKGNIQELKQSLLDEKLAIETEGVVPHKTIGANMWTVQNDIHLRILQIRINGRQEDNCINRVKNDEPRSYISDEIIEQLSQNCRYIPIETIRIEAEIDDPAKIEKVIRLFKCTRLELYMETNPSASMIDLYQKLFDGLEFSVLAPRVKNIAEPIVDTFNFFYSKYYNPCLGHQAAIDTDGRIKCCLWSDQYFGNILNTDIKDLIIRGAFDVYWELSKDRIQICKDCELRYNCNDCRVIQLKNNHPLESKPDFCTYNPLTGEEIC